MTTQTQLKKLSLLGLLVIGLSACGTVPNGKQDGPPLSGSLARIHRIPNAVPKPEPLSRGGNKSHYTVFKRKYHVMPSSKGFRQRGLASWYGRKWHGRKTANGEVYDMYAMTAAHKNLPLPTYAKVTNLDNGQHIIVRVNDRGPFHGNRVIDLSYTAAVKLGVLAKGVAHVEIEAIDPKQRHPRGNQKHLPAPIKRRASPRQLAKATPEAQHPNSKVKNTIRHKHKASKQPPVVSKKPPSYRQPRTS